MQHDLDHTQIKMARKQTPLSPQTVAHTRVHTTAISGWQADEGSRLVIFRGWDKCDVPVWEWCERRHVGSPYPELLQKAFVVAGEPHAQIFALKSLLKFLAMGKAQGEVESKEVLTDMNSGFAQTSELAEGKQTWPQQKPHYYFCMCKISSRYFQTQHTVNARLGRVVVEGLLTVVVEGLLTCLFSLLRKKDANGECCI